MDVTKRFHRFVGPISIVTSQGQFRLVVKPFYGACRMLAGCPTRSECHSGDVRNRVITVRQRITRYGPDRREAGLTDRQVLRSETESGPRAEMVSGNGCRNFQVFDDTFDDIGIADGCDDAQGDTAIETFGRIDLSTPHTHVPMSRRLSMVGSNTLDGSPNVGYAIT